MIPRFPGQKEDEIIKYLVRKHWIIYAKLMIFLVVMVGIPLTIYFPLIIAGDFSSNANNILTLCLFVYLSIIFLITYIRWLEDELDIMIVTNERVISIDQVSFLHRTISETELSQIQDVKHISKGLLSNIFGFGSLMVQTAAEKIVFEIHDVSKSDKMARCVMDLCNAYKREFAGQMQKNHHGGMETPVESGAEVIPPFQEPPAEGLGE